MTSGTCRPTRPGQRNKPRTVSEDFDARLASTTPRAWVTPALIALNVAVWLLNVLTGTNPLNPSPQDLLDWGGNFLPATEQQPWRLLSATLLHGGGVHLALNMWALYVLGPTAERFYGNSQFLLIYLVAGLFASLASLFFAARAGVSVGASGAIFGVIGALLSAVTTKADRLPVAMMSAIRRNMLMFVAYSLVTGFIVPQIDNAAHIGGLVSGFALAIVLAEKFDLEEFRRQAAARAAAALVASLVIGLLVWTLVPVGAR